ncbi:MAG: hypothetical protein HY866_14020 [Chloroflexi bacterium]|nr:hypothetical protein [Chloroflexota bacterium]
MSDYDPGDLVDPAPRRKRRHFDEVEDVWAAAEEDDLADPGVEIEDLAAGYHWEDRDRYGLEDPPDPTQTNLSAPPPARRPRTPRGELVSGRTARRYDRDRLYSDSPSYQRDQDQRRRTPQRFERPIDLPSARPQRGRSRGIPFWQILILVILGLTALLAVCLALASLTML